MIGKLKSKMEEERKKIETKKEKEGMFCDEVSDILSKHILQRLQSKTDLVDLFNHATKLDNLSNKIVDLFDQRDKLIRQLTTSIHLLAKDLKSHASAETRGKILNKIDTLISLDYENLDLKSVGGNLHNNLTNYKPTNALTSGSIKQRRSTITSISPEEISKLKGRLVSMIKTEQEEKPFKKILKKKLARYEQRLKTRNMKATKTQNYDSNSGRDSNENDKVNEEEEAKRLNDEFEKDNELQPAKLMPKRRMTMLKKQKTKGGKKAFL